MEQIRLALSGAGFRIPGHAGAMHAIEDAGIEIVEIAGTSAGSIVAGLYACGMTVSDMLDLCLTQNWSSMLTCDPISGWLHNGWCSGNNLLKFLETHTGGKTFSQTNIPLKIIAGDIAAERKFVFSKETTPDVSVAFACRCSASIPFVYAPVSYGDMILVDGGTSGDNTPADVLIVDSIPRYGVYLVDVDAPLKPGNYGTLTIASRIIDYILLSSETAYNNSVTKTGATIINVPSSYASTLDTNIPTEIRQRLITDGYNYTKAAINGH
jgi:NTE family protein